MGLPLMTGNPRRWPDVYYQSRSNPPPIADILARARIQDDDLVKAVTVTFRAWLPLEWNHHRDQQLIETEQLLCNVLDAAIEEQDRRNGIETTLGPRKYRED
jgi:hypothetical protein